MQPIIFWPDIRASGIQNLSNKIKTESTRKLSNSNFQSLYQNMLKNIAFFSYILHFYKLSVVTPKKNFRGSPTKLMNVKFHKNCDNTGKILKISCVRCS